MKKDAYYFPHDSNAKDDPKCSMLIEQLGCEGYGIYWVLVETLRDQPDYRYPLSMLSIIARKYNTTTEKARVVVGNYGLFEVDEDDFFLSPSLCRRMETWEKGREQRKLAGLRSAEKRLLSTGKPTTVERPLNDRSASVQQRKEKKRKEKKRELREETIELTPFVQALTDFEEMRQKIKKPLTDNAKKLLLKKLSSLSDIESEQIAILEQSTMNCWQGIFALKDENQKKMPRAYASILEAVADDKGTDGDACGVSLRRLPRYGQ